MKWKKCGLMVLNLPASTLMVERMAKELCHIKMDHTIKDLGKMIKNLGMAYIIGASPTKKVCNMRAIGLII